MCLISSALITIPRGSTDVGLRDAGRPLAPNCGQDALMRLGSRAPPDVLPRRMAEDYDKLADSVFCFLFVPRRASFVSF